jgi:hypothetical protein
VGLLGDEAMLEYDNGQWRANVRFRTGGARAVVRGPRRDCEAIAQFDLDLLLRAKAGMPHGQAACEAVKAAAAVLKASICRKTCVVPEETSMDDDLPDQKAEVSKLARQLGEAMQNGDEAAASELLWSLLEHPAGLDEGFVGGGNTLLAEAVRFGNQEVVETLLDHGASPNAACSSGLAPIHLAAMGGKITLLHLLLWWGADPRRGDSAGFSPLQKAILTAPSDTLDDVRELLLLSGGQESASDRQRMRRRKLADENDVVYLARFRGDAAAPPASGVASHIV